MGRNKIPGIVDDGSIKVEAIQKINDALKLLEYLKNFFKGTSYTLSFEYRGRILTVCFGSKGQGKKVKVEGFNGPRPADFLNTLGIIRAYNEVRNSQKTDDSYPEANSEINLGNLKGYGFSNGSIGIIRGYQIFPGDETIYAIVETPYGEIPIPAELLKRNSSQIYKK